MFGFLVQDTVVRLHSFFQAAGILGRKAAPEIGARLVLGGAGTLRIGHRRCQPFAPMAALNAPSCTS